MGGLDVPQFLGMLVVTLAAAKLFGAAARRVGQPAVLGELVAGVVLGVSVLGLVDRKNEALHLLAEIAMFDGDLHRSIWLNLASATELLREAVRWHESTHKG